ncbi:unnamed protein product [Cladocopium goreaui]|uniref:Apple domain-containing protein n=1 Tax=Cladocopium goreaui TaxID=2562237 RepID=A0A9P1DDM5_9DINO|nr:unnamed protein product [Cladocopium goreaui]
MEVLAGQEHSKDFVCPSSSSDESRGLLGKDRTPSEGRQSRIHPAVGAAVLGLSVLALVSAHLWLTPNRPSQGHLRGHQRVRKVPLEALVLKNEDHKEDLVVATTPLGRKTVVTENCIWHSCGNNTVCRLSALDGTDDGNRSANVTKTKGLAECRHLCEKTGEDCKGVEYNAETGRCEVWTQPIFSHRSCITGKDCPEADESLEQSSRCDDKALWFLTCTQLLKIYFNVEIKSHATKAPVLTLSRDRTWAVEPPRTAKSIFHKNTRAGTFHRPTTAPEFTRFDPVPGLPNLVQGVPASPRGKRLVPHAHRMPNIPVRGATAAGPWAECIVSPRKAAWPRHGTENSLMFRNPLERRAAHEGWGEEVSHCASPVPPSGPNHQTTQGTTQATSELPNLRLTQ